MSGAFPLLESVTEIDFDASDLPVGAKLIKHYKGNVYEVLVRKPLTTTPAAAQRGWWRYEFRGKRYKTLTAITYEITGQRTLSGNAFFGLRRRRRRSCRLRI